MSKIDDQINDLRRFAQVYRDLGKYAMEVVLLDAADTICELRYAVATAIRVQEVLCRDADSLYCRDECPLHRPGSNDCLECDVIRVAQELGIGVNG